MPREEKIRDLEQLVSRRDSRQYYSESLRVPLVLQWIHFKKCGSKTKNPHHLCSIDGIIEPQTRLDQSGLAIKLPFNMISSQFDPNRQWLEIILKYFSIWALGLWIGSDQLIWSRFNPKNEPIINPNLQSWLQFSIIQELLFFSFFLWPSIYSLLISY